jgi:hypothetical protein
VEEKIDIKPYACDIDDLKLYQWLQQLEFYFSVHEFSEEQIVTFT